ncbi:hypothetical protein MLD38_025080 [Melastoma candidum]|uniref:Uncharacterized protein n=1 Tax=Melastoma candidum TaxID=119954 RepID=A0ACB9P140_9MYRT|nr:hypothetical protein MLD38_025080 [Melastoma candidum]
MDELLPKLRAAALEGVAAARCGQKLDRDLVKLHIPCPVMCQDARGYVHPLVIRSGYVLGEKSLDVCTESLGCETGSDDFLVEEDEAEKYQMCPVFVHDRCSGGGELKSRKGNRSGPFSFPPPLKSMKGSSKVRIQPCRCDGRLVLQAVKVSSCRDSFLVERGGGRLRLSIYREQDKPEDDRQEEGARATIKGEGQEAEDEEEEERHENGKQESEEDEEKVNPRRRPSRCKEGKGPMTWKPRWVAT